MRSSGAPDGPQPQSNSLISTVCRRAGNVKRRPLLASKLVSEIARTRDEPLIAHRVFHGRDTVPVPLISGWRHGLRPCGECLFIYRVGIVHVEVEAAGHG